MKGRKRHCRMEWYYYGAAAALLIILGAPFQPISGQDTAVELLPLEHRFDQPLFVTFTDAHPEALFVVEKPGRVQVLIDGKLQTEPLLDLLGQVSTGSEQGLLGLAFHPSFADNGYFFVNYTDRSGTTQIVRYRVRPGTLIADPASAITLLSIPQPAANHNGGMMAFGPDGYLYIATGDGGGAGDRQGNAQNGATLLGKLLRIDVDGAESYGIPQSNPFVTHPVFRDEIWAFGLRNPWRFSFDRLTGDLYIADVGQNAWEEVNYLPANHPGGVNFGWNCMEGTHPYSSGGSCDPADLTMPVIEYGHRETGGCSITGGYVYRGSRIPGLVGKYVFGDYCSGEIWVAEPGDPDTTWSFTSLLRTNVRISSFGEDAAGELYVTDLAGGRVYQIVPAK